MQTPGQPSPALVSVWGVQYLQYLQYLLSTLWPAAAIALNNGYNCRQSVQMGAAHFRTNT